MDELTKRIDKELIDIILRKGKETLKSKPYISGKDRKNIRKGWKK